MHPTRCSAILLLLAIAACTTTRPGEIAAVPGAAPLAPEHRMVLDTETRASFQAQCMDGARVRQSAAVATRYCGCVLATAQTYVPPDEWTDAVLPGKTPRANPSTTPISPIFAKVASGCGALVEGL